MASLGLENLSDEEIRKDVRLMCSMLLDMLNDGGDITAQIEMKKSFIHLLKNSPIAIFTEDANEQHYEVPTEFFLKVLGPRLKYSCCYWPEGCKTLEDAENNFFDLLFERCEIKDGQTILDLGCGWGTTALEILERYPSCKVMAVSNSKTQKQFIDSSANKRGFSKRLNVITADANVFEPPKGIKFDMVISVEMFEHMKNYQELMRRISTWLKDDGKLFVHILCHHHFTYPFVTEEGGLTEWMAKNFFSGGTMPSADLLLFFQDHLSLDNIWYVNGNHYNLTLEAWLKRMDNQQHDIIKIFTEDQKNRTKGKELSKQDSINEIENYWRKWRTFFLYCAEVFKYNNGNDWMVSHCLFSKKQLQASL